MRYPLSYGAASSTPLNRYKPFVTDCALAPLSSMFNALFD